MCLDELVDGIRDVDAASPRTPFVAGFLTAWLAGRLLVGAGCLELSGSAARSCRVFRSLVGCGSGTASISNSIVMQWLMSLQPEGLCFMPLYVGGGIAKREFVPASFSSLRPGLRVGEEGAWYLVGDDGAWYLEGGLKPDALKGPCSCT